MSLARVQRARQNVSGEEAEDVSRLLGEEGAWMPGRLGCLPLSWEGGVLALLPVSFPSPYP